MDLHLLHVLGLLSLVLVVTTATPLPEDYWQSMLPNTPMPKILRHLLPSHSGRSRDVNVGLEGVSVSNIRPDQYGEVGPDQAGYGEVGPEQAYRDAALYLQEKDLVPGTSIMNIRLTKTTTMATFLPRQEVDTIPFSSDKFSDILQRFSVVPGSNEAQVMKNTIQECEKPARKGQEKYCATSLESMVDFGISKLGTNVQVVSTEVDKEETQKQKYTITGDVKKIASHDVVACHGQPYMYAVFYCHATHDMRAYKVPLVGADGTKANAIVVCHTNSAKLSPKNMAFQVRKVKPAAKVCHFLPEDQVVWVHN